MEDYIEKLFREAAYNCELCYNHFKDNPNEKNPHTPFAQAPLIEIMNSCNPEGKNWKNGKEAKNECDTCGFRDTKIKYYADYLGISLY